MTIPRTFYGLFPLCVAFVFCASACDRDDGNRDAEVEDLCPDDPNKTAPGVCGCGTPDVLNAITGLYTCMTGIVDFCPNDPNKIAPGICGCGVADTLGSDGIALCLSQSIDLCPNDPLKTLPGICGCGVPDDSDDGSGIPPCLKGKFDLCPDDPDKISPGVCGCNVPDTLDPDTGIPLCLVDSIDFCPNDPDKMKPGVCGCGTPDIDSDGDGTLDCNDKCPNDPDKVEPGTCGCNVADSRQNIADDDRDGTPNCLDFCPENPFKKDDDGCSCDEKAHTIANKKICAKMISNAKEFIDYLVAWNEGDESSIAVAYSLVDNINLADEIAADAPSWVGFGTKERPFNAIFFGNGFTISSVIQTHVSQIQLTLGEENRDDIALFPYTNGAQIVDLTVNLALVGRNYVAPFIAHAQKTTVSNIKAIVNVVAQNDVAGLIADMSSSIAESIDVSGIIEGKSYVGGIVAEASGSQIARARSTCSISAVDYVGGIAASALDASKFVDIHANASLTGGAYTGGILGILREYSSLYNAYSTSQVVCTEAPCSAFIAHVQNFVTVKNAYTAGQMTDQRMTAERPIDPDSTPEERPESPDLESEKSLPSRTPKTPSAPETPTSDDLPAAQIPLAMLIASFGTADNLLSSLYYWSETEISPLPADMMSAEIIPFEFTSLRPLTPSGKNLIDSLNTALLCNSSACSIDGAFCTRWNAGIFAITAPSSSIVMSVTIPELRF